MEPVVGCVDHQGLIGAYLADERRHATRPWVVGNMISSFDGAIAIDGRSGGLGGPADKAVFATLRSVADVIVVGAGTARDEGYGPPRSSAEARARRLAAGRADTPRLALVTRGLDLDPDGALFAADAPPPLVYVPADAPPARRAALDGVAEVVTAGPSGAVDPARLVADLGARGVHTALLEGGPRLNADFLAADLVDEWCVTVAPLAVGGTAPRLTSGGPPTVRRFRLDRALWHDELLFCRYLRQR